MGVCLESPTAQLEIGIGNGRGLPAFGLLDGGDITITGGTVIAVGGICGGAGIGGGDYSNGGNITITGGDVTATGGAGGAGIGGGGGAYYSGYGGSITISGGRVSATGGAHGAGIGGGDGGDSNDITISGDTIVAVGGDGAAGIGGGFRGNGGHITISGGNITATGGGTGPGIGCGTNMYGGYVTISNATVTASGCYAAIGGGNPEIQFGCTSIDVEDSATMHLSATSAGSDAEQFYMDYRLRTEIRYRRDGSDSAALDGNSALLGPVLVSGGNPVTLQWQESADNENWTDLDGETESEAHIPMSSANDGYYYRCQVTNAVGNVGYSDVMRGYVLAFRRQPEPLRLALRETGTLMVRASCTNVSYQWQRSANSGETWTDIPYAKTNALDVYAASSENHVLYRCVITATNDDQLISDSAEVMVTLEGNLSAYILRYYLENADEDGYALEEITLEGIVGETVSIPEKTYEFFTEDPSAAVESGVVTEDGELVLSRYYKRDTFTISFDRWSCPNMESITLRYGASITLPLPVRNGYGDEYNFGGWYTDSIHEHAFTRVTMPGEDLTLYAKWNWVNGGSYRSSSTYRINGITLLDDSYHELNGIPEDGFYARVSVTNLSTYATYVDTLILAAYDENGRMLGTWFLQAEAESGYTLTFGAYIANPDGDIALLKAFMIPALGSAVPLANTVEIGKS